MKRNDNRSKFGKQEHRRVLSQRRGGRGFSDGNGAPVQIEYLTRDSRFEEARVGSFWAWAPNGGAWLVVDRTYVEVTKRRDGTWLQA